MDIFRSYGFLLVQRNKLRYRDSLPQCLDAEPGLLIEQFTLYCGICLALGTMLLHLTLQL